MKRVLVVYKRSLLERVHHNDPRRMRRVIPAERRRLRAADKANHETLQLVRKELEKRKVKFDMVYRGIVSLRRKVDLVISVGGDGTFFLAAHVVENTPILGVNSDPVHSLGLHCGATPSNFSSTLDRVLDGNAKVTELNRLSVEVEGKRLPTLVTNDVLFAHMNPAAMIRYRLKVDAKQEVQRSSGLWISTASGSTAAVYAAGGKRMPIASKRIQYLVREPYRWPEKFRLLRGQASKRITVTSLIGQAAIWIDGSRKSADIGQSERVIIRTGAPPLRVLAMNDALRRRHFP